MRYLKFISILWLFLALPLQAAETKGLYESEVPVSSQGASARTEGLREAMNEVLVKVSGTSRVSDDAELADAISSPGRYVQQYRYSSDMAAGGRLVLQASFDRKSIDKLLRDHGYTIWGKARPATLVWLGVEDNGSRVLVGANDGGLIHKLIADQAERRAIPLKLPLLDSTDRRQVQAADVWGDFLDTIKDASARYDVQAILVGKLYPVSGGRWAARWTLDYHGDVKRWQSQSSDVSQVVTEAVDKVADQLAKSFAQSFASGSGEMLLRVDGVSNLDEYRRVLDYLRGVHGVKQVNAESVSANAVRFHLYTSGGSDAVLRVIALGNTLEQVEHSQPVMPSAYSVAPAAASIQRDLPPGAAYTDEQAPAEQNAYGSNGATAATAEPPLPELFYRLLP